MINEISLRNFKCFEILKLPLAELTLLSGPNASGKSSVLQALILLHQTMREHEWSTRLLLNGDELKLGTVLDVVDEIHGREAIDIGIVDNETLYLWNFVGDRQEMSMAVNSVSIGDSLEKNPKTLQHLLPTKTGVKVPSLALRLRDLTYVSAERVGPRDFYPLKDPQDAVVVGAAGENAVSVLHSGRDEKVNMVLTLKDAPNNLLRQVEVRMQTFFPGAGLVVEQVPKANFVILGLRNSEDTGFHRPIHAGFGLTQILPIIVAALTAKKDALLLIENPEVHLHPAGQALMGQFLADVACAGVQVILETHSDHILNGVRRSVKAKRLKHEQVELHFFRPRKQEGAQVVSPQLDSSGNIDEWPEGFFDQFDKDMNYFAGWGD